MSYLRKSTQLRATLMLVIATLLSCGVQTLVCAQGGGRPTEAHRAPLPNEGRRRQPPPTPPKDNVGMLIAKGITLNKQGDHDGAITALTQAINLDRRRAAAYYNRGNAFYDKTDYNSALADYTEAIDLDPRYDDAYYGRARAYSSKNDYDHAIADYTKAIAIDPMFADAYRERGFNVSAKNMAKNIAGKGAFNEGMDDLSEAIRLDPDDKLVYFYRGLIYTFKEDSESAIADLTKTIRLDPNYTDAYQWRGLTYYSKDQYGLAIADFTDAIRLGSKTTLVYYWRGDCFYKKGDYNRAIDSLTEYIKLEPGLYGSSGYSLRAQVYDLVGRHDLAAVDRQKLKEVQVQPAP